jgi:hypothetical protein
MDRNKKDSSREAIPSDADAPDPELDLDLNVEDRRSPEPPHTTTRHMTSPKFGSAGSGGAELEPGPER